MRLSFAGGKRQPRGADPPEERGSALVMAIFVMVLLAGMGTTLLFLSETEQKMGNANLRTIRAFYLAEAGIEDGRTTLWDTNRADDFDDDLDDAAGDDDVIDFDVTAIAAVRDINGRVTGFTGFNDDVPVKAATAVDGGMYIAFLTNDPVDGIANQTDSNDRVMITGVGAGPDGSFEIAQAIIELRVFLPAAAPATITVLGPQPDFAGGNSKKKTYQGEDCGGGPRGIPSLYMPVIGAVGSEATADPCPKGGGSIVCGWDTNPTFESGLLSDTEVFADLDDALDPAVVQSGQGRIDPDYLDCQFLRDMMMGMRVAADAICADGTALGPPKCPVPASRPERIIYAEGDFAVGPGDHEGVLAVAGELTMSGRASWTGLVLVIGEGVYRLNGAGNGEISGGMVVADIAGPDNIFGTKDDCTGGDNGYSPAVYDERGGGNAGSVYCSTDLTLSNPAWPYEVVEFVQR